MTEVQMLKNEISLLLLTNAEQQKKLDLAERRLAAIAAEQVSIVEKFDTRMAGIADRARATRFGN